MATSDNQWPITQVVIHVSHLNVNWSSSATCSGLCLFWIRTWCNATNNLHLHIYDSMRFDDIAITIQTVTYHGVDKESCKSYGIKLIGLNPAGNEQWHVVRMIRCIRMFHGSPFWIFEAFATRLADPGKSITHLILLIYASTIGQCWPINCIIKGGILGYYKAQLIWTWDSIQFANVFSGTATWNAYSTYCLNLLLVT